MYVSCPNPDVVARNYIAGAGRRSPNHGVGECSRKNDPNIIGRTFGLRAVASGRRSVPADMIPDN